MNFINNHTGFAIALAWPETYCKQPGSWYDPLMLFFGINQNNYYKAGHAAVILADIENYKFHYFDFGRYHAPFGHARVRSAETDDDLTIFTTPIFSEDKSLIKNLDEILNELQNNPSCHGEGTLHASYIPVHFQKALNKVKQMQEESPIPYGPFIIDGSNCSRFVNSVIRAGSPDSIYKLKLKFKVPFTPTPISNVNALKNKMVLPKLLKTKPFVPLKKLEHHLLHSTLYPPEKHPKIPENAQWLSGEGAGSWFVFNVKDQLLHVKRFAPDGKLECAGIYENNDKRKLINKDFKIIHPSNCKVIHLTDGERQNISFVRITNG